MSNLLDNLNSEYWANFNYLEPAKSPNRIVAYVEDNQDISFWRLVLEEFETEKLKFDVCLDTNLVTGKYNLLKNKNRLNNFMIICIDSDYHYILDNTTEISRLINNNPYIFQTYTYSIENYKCYANSLSILYSQITNCSESPIDFKKLLKTFSLIIHKAFLWSVYFYQISDTISFPIKELSKLLQIKINTNIQNQETNYFQELQNRFANKIKELEQLFPDFSDKIKNIAKLINSEDTYLLINGHALFDYVVSPFLRLACDYGFIKKLKEIENSKLNSAEKKQRINQYRNQTLDAGNVRIGIKNNVLQALNNNTNYQNCKFYNKIKSRISEFVENFKKKNLLAIQES